MNFTEFQVAMRSRFPWLTDDQFAQIAAYKRVLQAANASQNLTRLAGEDVIYEEYFLASAILYERALPQDGRGRLLDIGSGSGVPGVLLKIIYPQLDVTLLDANQKKTTFLRDLVSHLGLGVEVITGRAEVVAYTMAEQFDYVTARAVADTRKILELAARFLRVGGLILLPKSWRWDQEKLAAQGAIAALHVAETNHFTVTDHGHLYHLAVFEKVGATPPGFPRSWPEILKKPL